MSTPEQPTAAGWYDDPQDRTQLRYFDGVLWTSHVTPRQTRAQTPAPVDQGWNAPPSWDAQNPNPYAVPSANVPGHVGPAPTYPGHAAWGVPPQGFGPDHRPLAAWWQRLLAAIIDSVVVTVLVVLVSWHWMGPLVDLYVRFVEESMAAVRAGLPAPIPDTFLTQATPYLLPILVVSVTLRICYHTGFLVWRGATPGKMILGTQVVRLDEQPGIPLLTALTRQAISIGNAVLAIVPVLSLLSNLVVLADVLWLLWDPRRQCLHDKLAKTVVVQKR